MLVQVSSYTRFNSQLGSSNTEQTAPPITNSFLNKNLEGSNSNQQFISLSVHTLINAAVGIHIWPTFWPGVIDAAWCNKDGQQMHSNSENILYRCQGRYVVFALIGFWFLY